MKYTAILIALLLAIGTAFADQITTNKYVGEAKVAHGQGANPVTVRTGGEDIASATAIATIPYYDVASTCGALNNYDEICPYGPATSPDVVYKYTPTTAKTLVVSLCNSYYDTKLFVYQDAATPGAPLACNDDGCSGPNYPYAYLSTVSFVANVGHTYYIVVDGYGGGCGTYDMAVTELTVCDLTCPPGASIEGEPLCGTNYVDSWNGGCNSTPYVFQPLCPPVGSNTAVLCGESGTYTYFGYSYRDTDWFPVWGVGGNVTATVCASFPVQLIILYGVNQTYCTYAGYVYSTANPYVALTLSYPVAASQEAWVWVGPSTFYGIPCGSDYLLTVTGVIRGPGCPVATENTSWGAIKSLYR